MTSLASPANGAAQVIASLQSWATSPFQEPQDILQWFLWTGLIVVAVTAWIFILHELKDITD